MEGNINPITMRMENADRFMKPPRYLAVMNLRGFVNDNTIIQGNFDTTLKSDR
jgi:hypothetical protein